MQIGPMPLPTTTAAVPAAQTVTQALPQVQALAAAPITQTAVSPTNKSDSGQKTRDSTNKPKQEGGDKIPGEDAGNGRGHIINTSV